MTDRATPARAAAPAPLAPCPFCGGTATIASRSLHGGPCWCAYCRNDECDVAPASDHHPTEEEAVTAWNRRAPTLLVALDGRGAGWQPIDGGGDPAKAAPRDGSVVDLWAENRRHVDCHFRDRQWVAWNIFGATSGFRPVVDPTHWFLMPAPPAHPQPAGEVGDD